MYTTIDHEGCDFRIEFEVLNWPTPEKTNCLPEDARPAESGELDIKWVYLLVGGEMLKLEHDNDLHDRIIEENGDDLWQAAEEDAKETKAEAAEARWEARHEQY